MIALWLWGCAKDLNAPPEIAFDHEACDECGMLVGEPRFAAAIVTRDGDTLAFDDAGCLFRYVLDEQPSVAHMWFSDGEGWYNEAQVAFAVDAVTPMGSGLRAVPAGTPGSISVGEASSRAVSK
ncbi:MAG: hypothetical protein ACOZNI_21945 [Myxococcota bacterium]